MFKFDARFPGSQNLKITIQEVNKLVFTKLIGSIDIDLEEYYFNREYINIEKKPCEDRVVNHEIMGFRGNLRMIIDMYPTRKDKKPFPIGPQEKKEFEMQIIVWKTKDCTIKNAFTKSNDQFVRGVIKGEEQETDTHYFCRGEGSFNYRMKFPMTLPIDVKTDYGANILQVSLWDQCFVGANNLIGEAQVYLNDHKILWKSYLKEKEVKMQKKVLGSGNKVDKMWYKVYNPMVKDANGKKKLQGQVLMSFKVMPKEDAEKKENGQGRNAPNNFPVQPDPVGRFNFNLFDPIGMFKMLVGPDNCNNIYICFCTMFALSIAAGVGYLLINYLLMVGAVKTAG